MEFHARSNRRANVLLILNDSQPTLINIMSMLYIAATYTLRRKWNKKKKKKKEK